MANYTVSRRKRNRTGGAVAPSVDEYGNSLGSVVGGAPAPGVGAEVGRGITTYRKTSSDSPRSIPPAGQIAPVNPVSTLSKKYNVLQSPYKNQGDLDARAKAMAQAQIQPTLDAITAGERREGALHTGRSQAIIDLGNWAADKYAKAQQTGAAANQALQTNVQTLNTANAAGLAGQAGADAAAQNALATRLQGTAPASDEAQQLMAAATAHAGAGMGNITNNLGAMNAAAAEATQMAPVFVNQASVEENARNLAALQDLQGQRTDASARLGNLTTSAIGTLEDQELQRASLSIQQKQNNREFQLAKSQLGEAKANRLFQQYMAEQEFGLKSQNQSFQQWLAGQNLNLNREQLNLDKAKYVTDKNIQWAQIGIQKQGVLNDLAALNAEARKTKDANKREQAKLKADAYNAALSAFNGYMSPGKNEAPQGVNELEEGQVKYTPRTWDGALQSIMQTGVTQATAWKILSHSSDPSWRERANRLLKNRGPALSKKNRRNTQAIANSGIGWLDGGPLGVR